MARLFGAESHSPASFALFLQEKGDTYEMQTPEGIGQASSYLETTLRLNSNPTG